MFPLYLPHLLCYLFSKQKLVIDEDMEAWSKYRCGLIGKSCTSRLVSLLTNQKDFRTQFYGDKAPGVGLDALSGATFSSKGMKSAVDTALKVYTENKEAILNGGK